MQDINFNQTMISKLINSTPIAVSRAIKAKKIENIDSEFLHAKKYTLPAIREITNEMYANIRRPIRDQMQSFYNFKGGTGKTSLSFQVAVHLSLLGFNVLCIDLDPQAHLTTIMGIPEGFNGFTMYDCLINGVPINDAILNCMEGLDIIPSNISTTRIEVQLNLKHKREEKLKELLIPLKDKYDFIILDTNPTISTLNMNALVASDKINIICETQPFSLNGLRILVEEMLDFFNDMKINPNYCIIPNKFEIKTATSQEVLGALRAEYSQYMLNAVVRKSEDINLASKKKLPVSSFCKSRSSSFEDIMDLVHEIVTYSSTVAKK